MPQSRHCLRNDLQCVEWDVKPYYSHTHEFLLPEGQNLLFSLYLKKWLYTGYRDSVKPVVVGYTTVM